MQLASRRGTEGDRKEEEEEEMFTLPSSSLPWASSSLLRLLPSFLLLFFLVAGCHSVEGASEYQEAFTLLSGYVTVSRSIKKKFRFTR